MSARIREIIPKDEQVGVNPIGCPGCPYMGPHLSRRSPRLTFYLQAGKDTAGPPKLKGYAAIPGTKNDCSSRRNLRVPPTSKGLSRWINCRSKRTNTPKQTPVLSTIISVSCPSRVRTINLRRRRQDTVPSKSFVLKSMYGGSMTSLVGARGNGEREEG